MKKNVVVIFGGDSSEHDVSCLSATTVIKNMDTEKYNVILVGITKEGRWLLVDSVKDIEDGSWREGEDLLMIIYRRRITNNEIQTMNYKLSVWKRKLYLSQAPLPV